MLSFQDKIRPVGTQATSTQSGLSFADKIRQTQPTLASRIASPDTTGAGSAFGTLTGPLREGISGLGTLYGGSEQGIASKLYQDVQAGAKDIQAGGFGGDIRKANLPLIAKGVAKAGFRTAGDVAGTIYAPVGAAIGATGIGKLTDWLGGTIANSSLMNKITDIPAVQDFAQKHPNAGEDFGRALNIIFAAKEKGKIEPSTVIPRTLEQVKAIPPQAQALYKAITFNSPQQIDNFINTQYQKGVRPTVSGKNTLGQVERASNNQLTAVKTIVENKPNLNILDQYGDPTGRVPETLNQFSQGIEQTKSQIFKQYDALQKQAGQAGAVVDLKPVSNELNVVASDKVLNDLHPEIAKYAQDRATAFNARGVYNTEEAQNAVKILNKSLDAFYKNPSYETASKASIDSMVVNKLREGLDTTIENNASPGYQDLKNKYGALKSIEKDVIHRAIVDGRKNTKGLLDFTDIASGAELVRGLLTMNPVDLAASATIKGISMYQKYLNNPNTAIKRLFQAAEKTNPSTGQITGANRPATSINTKLGVKSPTYNSTLPQSLPKVKGAIPETTLAQEARKYKSAEYKIQHQITNGKSAGDLTNLDDIVKQHKINNGYLTKYDIEDLNKLKKIQGKPEMDIKIYRASPKNELNSGDWITTSKTYAGDIKKQNGGKVYEYTVKAKDLIYPNDITELPSLARFSAFKYEPKLLSKIDNLNPLLQEARKYKSAEEFVKAQPTIYHGTSGENAAKINSDGFKAGGGKGVSGQGSSDFIYATENKVSAGKYVADRLGIKNPTTVSGSFNGKVLEISGKLSDAEAFGEASKKLGVPLGKDSQGGLSMLDMPAIKKAMQEQGYGAIRFSDRYANGSKALAILPDQIKTKSQLTDIWKQANKK